MDSDKIDYMIKLLVIGDSGTGKTCLIRKFSENNFTPEFVSTMGIDFRTRDIDVNGKKVRFQIWDTAGQERFRTITASYYRGAKGILMLYDISNARSFDNIRSWIREAESRAEDSAEKMIVGSKCDLIDQRDVSREKAKELANEVGIDCMETSALDGTNVELIFTLMANKIIQKMPATSTIQHTNVIRSPTIEKESSCCGMNTQKNDRLFNN